ncbi:alpha/beta fold hydrolase [Paenibacillus terreus]|uniref:Alpha/beta fold hydrolase n=1 Tax=Paenibacillus terreus TaxID=1387834 RepID=A0ABV5BBX9_9BACL
MGRYIQAEKDVKIFVEDIGNGTPVIFVHGWPLNHLIFEYQYTFLAARGYRCIGIDLRGFGKSDAPWEGYSYDHMADDLRAVIDELQLENAVLVGYSMGGAVAVRYMARHHEHGISRLLLAVPATPSFTQRDDFPYGTDPDVLNKQLIETAMKDRPAMLAKVGLKVIKARARPALMVWLGSLCLQASHHGTVKAAAALRDEDLRQDLARITVPTVIFQGKKDKICKLELTEKTCLGIRGSRIVCFENSGHALMFDEQDKFNEELLAFLEDKEIQVR